MTDAIDKTHAYKGRTDTSAAAAESIEGETGTLRRKVFDFIISRGARGATLNEMEELLPMTGNTLRPRRKELEGMGAVVDSGKRRINKGGRETIVWAAADRYLALDIKH